MLKKGLIQETAGDDERFPPSTSIREIMLPPDHFLSDVVQKALQVAEGKIRYQLEDNYVTAKLSDPFKGHLVS
jgi:hypothetical protein